MTEDKTNTPAEPPRAAPPRYVERVPACQRMTAPKPAGNAAARDTEPGNVAAPGKPSADDKSTGAKELGGPKGPEPTRFGDWERDGRCVDF